jgi:hypothetical protein
VAKLIEESEGIKAIIFLQKYAGIDESHEKARQGWRSMTIEQRNQTMVVYSILKPKEKKGQ